MSHCIACDTIRETVRGKTRQPGWYAMFEYWELDTPEVDGTLDIEPGPLCRYHAKLAAPSEDGHTILMRLFPEAREM